MQISLIKKTAAMGVLAVASAMAGANTTILTPVSPASPTADDNGSLLLLVWDPGTQQSLVWDLGLRIDQIKPGGTANITAAGTVLDFGFVNLSSYGITSSAQYQVVAADYAPPSGGGNGGPGGGGNALGSNLYITGTGIATLTDSDRSVVQSHASTLSSYLGSASSSRGVFNNTGFIGGPGPGGTPTTLGCAGTNPCATLAPADPRYIGPVSSNIGGATVTTTKATDAFNGTAAVPNATIGTSLDFWALTVSTDGTNEHLNKLQYADGQANAQFLLAANGHLTYTSGVPIYELSVAKAQGASGDGTVSSAPTGINCGTSCLVSFAAGTSLTLTATPVSGSLFAGWEGSVCSGTADCVVTMDAAKSVTARFESLSSTQSLTVVRDGNGTGTVTSNPAGIDCGSTCSASYSAGTSVTLTAASAAGSTFTVWSGACTGTGPTCTVAVNSTKTVHAEFTSQKVLSVSLSGEGAGTVSSAPGGINCGTSCSVAFNLNTVVKLTASPDQVTSKFAGWSGACSGTSTSCDVTMSDAQSVTARFDKIVSTTEVIRSGGGAFSWDWLALAGLLLAWRGYSPSARRRISAQGN